ncbi:MAG TPA: T9SS type A sorting domain-containing protein [Bacteroidia bacterium]|nr:T9SS type A sorting domain-containing protein [Bacteroidia bacterium]
MIQKLHAVIIYLIIILSVSFIFAGNLVAQYAVSTLAGTSTQGNPFAGPNGICITPDGTSLYLADYTAQRIKKINIGTGAVSNYAGNGTAGYLDGSLLTAKFNYPSGIKISSDGLFLYVCDNNNCLIRKIDVAAGTVSTVAGVYNAFSFADNANGLLAMFNQPTDLTIAPGDSVLYVSDTENHIIRKINLLTTAVTTIAGTPVSYGSTDGIGAAAKFHNPKGICISGNGVRLYIADAGNNKIRKIELANLMVSTVAGNGIASYIDNTNGLTASFNIPQGLCALSNDSLLYIDDTFNNRIRQINLTTTEVSTLAGTVSTPNSHFVDNGNGLLAKFYHPVNSILSKNSDKLYISDQENYRVRIMNTDVVVTSVNENISDNIFSIYPNPVRDYLTIQLKTIPNDSYSYSIVDARGRPIIAETKISATIADETVNINVKNVSDGIYFLQLMLAQKFYSMKIIKMDD